MTALLLDVDHVGMTYVVGGLLARRTVRAVDDVSLRLEAGKPEILAVIGESGSGKTTLARMILNLAKPTDGAIRFLGKREVFDAPLIGPMARAMGGIRVDRGTGSDEPLRAAAEALETGQLVAVMPQGTIPRGPAFFDPKLRGRWGAARLAQLTGAPVIPVGLWGTEKVWPRSSRLPHVWNLASPPKVTVEVGEAVALKGKSLDADTKRIMKAIAALLPAEASVARVPSAHDLALTYPPGYKGDPAAEVIRRPGDD